MKQKIFYGSAERGCRLLPVLILILIGSSSAAESFSQTNCNTKNLGDVHLMGSVFDDTIPGWLWNEEYKFSIPNVFCDSFSIRETLVNGSDIPYAKNIEWFLTSDNTIISVSIWDNAYEHEIGIWFEQYGRLLFSEGAKVYQAKVSLDQLAAIRIIEPLSQQSFEHENVFFESEGRVFCLGYLKNDFGDQQEVFNYIVHSCPN